MAKINFLYIAIITVIVGVAGVGFYYAGSPKNARSEAADRARINDLQNIVWAANGYGMRYGTLARSISDLKNEPDWTYLREVNPLSGEAYTYEVLDDNTGNTKVLSFQVCATFLTEAPSDMNGVTAYVDGPDDWSHTAGRHCFRRSVNTSVVEVGKPVPARY